MNKLVAYFEYNGENFFISLVNNKEIRFFKKNKDNEIVEKLLPSEHKLMRKIYNSIRINHNESLFIKKIAVNSNLYNLFYDKNSNNYFWTSNAGIDDEKDNSFLNFRYNHHPNVLYLNTSDKQLAKPQSDFFNKFVKIGKKFVSISVAATLSLNLLAGCTLRKPDITETTEVIVETIKTTASDVIETTYVDIEETTEEKREYNWDVIKQAIKSNPNLSAEEKQIIISLKFVFDKDNQYMDLDMIIERLSTLQILYGFSTEELNAAGTYNFNKNIIKIAAPNFKEANLHTIIHEIGHVFQHSGARHFIEEWSNSKWTVEVLYKLYNDNLIDKRLFLNSYGKELFDKGELSIEKEPDFFLGLSSSTFTGGYDTYIPLYCILADLLDYETLICCHYNPSHTDKIVDKLLEIDSYSEGQVPSNEEINRAYQLIYCLDDLRIYDSTTDKYQYSRDLSQVLTYLDYYYTKTTGKSINDNPEYNIIFSKVSGYAQTGNYFINNSNILNDLFSGEFLDKYGAYSSPDILFVKPYFGYSENPNNILSFLFEAVPIDNTLFTEFEQFINSLGRSLQ